MRLALDMTARQALVGGDGAGQVSRELVGLGLGRGDCRLIAATASFASIKFYFIFIYFGRKIAANLLSKRQKNKKTKKCRNVMKKKAKKNPTEKYVKICEKRGYSCHADC